MSLFWDETKPSKHRLKPSEQIKRTSLQVAPREVASLYVSHALKQFFNLSQNWPSGFEILFELDNFSFTHINETKMDVEVRARKLISMAFVSQ